MAFTTLIANPTSLDFGDVPIGTSQTASIEFSMDGDAGDSITVDGIVLPTGYTTNLATPFTVTLNSPVNGNITFSPTSKGSYNNAIVVDSNAEVNPSLDISVTGYGDTIQVVPASYDFDLVEVNTTSSQFLFTINNLDPVNSLTVTAITIPTNFGAGGTFPSLPLVIAASGNAQFGITFSPTALVAYAANIAIASDGSSSSINVPVSGVGAPPFVVGYHLPFFAATSGIVASRKLPLSSVELSDSASNGGLSGGLSILAMPSYGSPGDIISYFNFVAVQDFTDLTTDSNSFSVSFPAQDTLELRPATIKKIILSCYNLGVAEIGYFITGFYNNQEISLSGTITIPYDSTQPNSFIVQAEADCVITANLFQLQLVGHPLSAPFGIVKAKLVTTFSQDAMV